LLKPPGIGGGLGYRGISVQAVREPRLDPHVYLHAGIIDLDRFDYSRQADTPDLEKWLLGTAGGAVEANVRGHVQSALKGLTNFPADSAGAGPSDFAGPPAFDPGKWNNDPGVRTRNNCYNYANDKITNTFAQPGRGSGGVFPALTCDDVGAAAVRDGRSRARPRARPRRAISSPW
jgi:hypothetical protein